jgi:hypothetical protein
LSSFDTDPVPFEHKVKLDIYPSVVDQTKVNLLISDDIKGDSIFGKIGDVDEAIGMNPFLESSINNLKSIQTNVLDVTLPDITEEIEETEMKKNDEKKRPMSIRIPSNNKNGIPEEKRSDVKTDEKKRSDVKTDEKKRPFLDMSNFSSSIF